MAAENGRDRDPVIDANEAVFAEPYSFDFFAVVRELRRLYPKRRPIGGDGPAAEEVVRFRSRLSLGMPASEIAGATPSRNDRPAEVEVALLGMLGNTGVLPHELTEWILAAKEDGEALREFIDLLLHRPFSLLYSIGESLRPGAAYEHRRGEPGWWVDDPYVSAGLRAVGATNLPDGIGERFAAPLISLGRYAGSITAYEDGAAAHLGVPVRVQPLRGRWRAKPAPEDGEFRDVRGEFRVVVGPMPWSEYEAFLPPTGQALRDLLDLTRLVAGAREFDIELQLNADEHPPCVPGTDARFSLTAWPARPPGVAPFRGNIPACVCRQLLDERAPNGGQRHGA